MRAGNKHDHYPKLCNHMDNCHCYIEIMYLNTYKHNHTIIHALTFLKHLLILCFFLKDLWNTHSEIYVTDKGYTCITVFVLHLIDIHVLWYCKKES